MDWILWFLGGHSPILKYTFTQPFLFLPSAFPHIFPINVHPLFLRPTSSSPIFESRRLSTRPDRLAVLKPFFNRIGSESTESPSQGQRPCLRFGSLETTGSPRPILQLELENPFGNTIYDIHYQNYHYRHVSKSKWNNFYRKIDSTETRIISVFFFFFAVLGSGGIVSFDVYARHYAIDIGGSHEQLRNIKNSSGQRRHITHAPRRQVRCPGSLYRLSRTHRTWT